MGDIHAMIIYQAYRIDTPKFYIGKTIKTLEHRMKQHQNEAKYNRSNSYFHKALRKYGNNAFKWVELERCNTIEELNAAEIRWIKLLKDCNHKVYNLVDGGNGGDCGGSMYWKTHTQSKEMRQKISEGLKKYYRNNINANKGKTRIGHKHTEETKIKISNTKIGHRVTEETREKLRQSNLGKKLNPDVINFLKTNFSGKNNPSAKRIICTTTNEIFDYAKLAAIKYDIDLSSIIKCCKGKVKSCKKLHFEYSPITTQQGGF